MADDSGRSAAWGVVAVVFGGGAVASWVEAVTSQGAFVPWAAAASALTLLSFTGVYMCFAILNHWPPIRQRKEAIWDVPERSLRELGKGLGALIPTFQAPQPPGPLEIKLEDEDWQLWRDVAWIVALKVRITNKTAAHAVRLKLFSLRIDIALGAQASGIHHEIGKRTEYYSPRLSTMDLQPGDSISGWFVRAAALPPRGGRPRCTFIVTDSLGDTYELDIPARPPRAHRMPSYYGPDDPEAELSAEDYS